MRQGDGVGVQVLRGLGVDLNKVRTAVEFIIGRGDRAVVNAVGLTPRAKRVIELAIDESRRLGHKFIGTEHLLIGLMREGEGIAAGVPASLGVTLDRLRHEVIRVLSESPSGAGAADSDPQRRGQSISVSAPSTIDHLNAGEMTVESLDVGYHVVARLIRDTRPDEDAQVAFYKVVGAERHFVWGFPIPPKSYAVDAQPISGWVLGGGAGRYVARVVGDDGEVLAEAEFRVESTGSFGEYEAK
jgi:hypothetical protein